MLYRILRNVLHPVVSYVIVVEVSLLKSTNQSARIDLVVKKTECDLVQGVVGEGVGVEGELGGAFS